MAAIQRLDDAVVRSLISTRTLWTDFPKFETLHTKITSLPKKGCNCRQEENPMIPILTEAKNYIRTFTGEQKQKLKNFLKADYLKLLITDPTGRHTDITI